ncbi:putative biotin synthase-like [Sesbania bispinosa]|nr:putative biotin synthase-like [Sesbania bispinosa]
MNVPLRGLVANSLQDAGSKLQRKANTPCGSTLEYKGAWRIATVWEGDRKEPWHPRQRSPYMSQLVQDNMIRRSLWSSPDSELLTLLP